MAINEIIEMAKKYYPEPITSKMISEETGISRGTVLNAITRIRAHPSLYDEVVVYEDYFCHGKCQIKVLYDKYYEELKK